MQRTSSYLGKQLWKMWILNWLWGRFYLQNEIMILNKIGLKSGIDRFDIVVVKTDNNRIIKRVIGLPGESVMYEDGKLYINGKYVEDSYSLSETKDFENIVLKEDEYFVLGDNREVSKDSRMIGPVKKEQILGKTRLVIFPFTKIRIEKWHIYWI